MANPGLAFVVLFGFLFFQGAHGWGFDGHYTVCKIAQSRLGKVAADAVNALLPKYAEGDLASLCNWADKVKFRYPWSKPLHYLNTPDKLCTYKYSRDCKDEQGERGRCVAGAIGNYTTQLNGYGSSQSTRERLILGNGEYNQTEALLFFSHFIGDIHQPLHVGFGSDRGGNTINVHWYTRKQVLHHVWDVDIIETAEQRYYDSKVEGLINALQQNITTEWADEVEKWESCGFHNVPCPDTYATEGIEAACNWAYKGVSEGDVLEDDYFLSRLPIVYLRLAQAGVRLAASLNRIFTPMS